MPHTPIHQFDDFIKKLSYALRAKHSNSKPSFFQDRISFDTQSQNPELLRKICASKGYILDPIAEQPSWYSERKYHNDAYRVSIPCVIPHLVAPEPSEQQQSLLRFLKFWNEEVRPCGFSHKYEHNKVWVKTGASAMEREYLSELGILTTADGELDHVSHPDWINSFGMYFQLIPYNRRGWIFPNDCEDNPHEGDLDDTRKLPNIRGYYLGNIPSNYVSSPSTQKWMKNTSYGGTSQKHDCNWSFFMRVIREELIMGKILVTKWAGSEESGCSTTSYDHIRFKIEELSNWRYTRALLRDAVQETHRSPKDRYTSIDPITWIKEVYGMHQICDSSLSLSDNLVASAK
jgi:hypothetical protein